MIQIILIIIGIILLISFFSMVIKLILGILAIAVLIFAGYLYIKYWKITVPISLGIVVINWIEKVLKRLLARRYNKKLVKKGGIDIVQEEVNKTIFSMVQSIYESDSNRGDYKFVGESVPYGRANAFLRFFNRNVFFEEPYFYSCFPSSNKEEFREYGILISKNGIFVSKENGSNKGDFFYPFRGMKKVEFENNKLVVIYINERTFDDNRREIKLPEEFKAINALKDMCSMVVNTRIGISLLKIRSITDTQKPNLDIENVKIDKMIDKDLLNRLSANVAVEKSTENMNEMFEEMKHWMNGRQGQGYAGEYANYVFDRLLGNNISGHKTDNNRQTKDGYDRIVNGQQIQTKYFKHGADCINDAFDLSGIPRYIDDSGKMMAIEVPCDQYMEAVEHMQKKIDAGLVPNMDSGETAEDYVKKGVVTWNQACLIAKAGTIEGIVVDMGAGIVYTCEPAGISGLITFAVECWHGETIGNAMKKSFWSFSGTMAKGVVTYTVAMQLSRIKVSGNTLDEILFGGQEGTAKAVSSIIAYGPDVFKMLTGKISVTQLIKNSIITYASIAVGEALIPIPIVGGVIGGCIGGFVAKNILDQFIEDDAEKMFQILKEEFIDGISIADLSDEELQQVINATIQNPELPKILQDMYASGEYRAYARIAIIDAAMINVLSKRPKITDEMFWEGFWSMLSEVA